jgi:hypothetical protein
MFLLSTHGMRETMWLRSNLGATTPKHHGKPSIIKDQKTKLGTTTGNPVRSAKPPSSVHGHSGLFRASSRHSIRQARSIDERESDSGRFWSSRRRRVVGVLHAIIPGADGCAIAAAGQHRGHAAALSDGHALQDADRFASTRAWRAAATRAIKSAGTASPVPKYISSGVCPRNAECGST